MALNFEEHCNRMNNYITIGKDRQNMHHAKRVLRYFLDSMKKSDPVFGRIAQNEVMAGSYADDIKVSLPNEFDFLVLLKFPNFKQYEVTESKPAHIIINAHILNINVQNEQQAKVKSMLDQNGYLKKSAIHFWIHQLLDQQFNQLTKLPNEKAKYELSIEGHRYWISRKRSGPAHTFNIQVKGGWTASNDFSIDMVPALCLGDERWVSKTRKFDQNWNGKWHAIPKEYKVNNNKKGITDNDLICSYADIERLFIKDKTKIKNMIRIFKKLRDTNNLATLKSYYIKTLFLWKTESVSRTYWSSTSMEQMFFEMFGEMLKHVEAKKLPFFWDRRYNMFDVWTVQQHQHLLGNLKKINDKLLTARLNKNWDILPSILLDERERAEYAKLPIKNSSGNTTPSSSQENEFEIIENPAIGNFASTNRVPRPATIPKTNNSTINPNDKKGYCSIQ